MKNTKLKRTNYRPSKTKAVLLLLIGLGLSAFLLNSVLEGSNEHDASFVMISFIASAILIIVSLGMLFRKTPTDYINVNSRKYALYSERKKGMFVLLTMLYQIPLFALIFLVNFLITNTIAITLNSVIIFILGAIIVSFIFAQVEYKRYEKIELD